MIKIWIDSVHLEDPCGDPQTDTMILLSEELAKKFYEELGKFIESDKPEGALLILDNNSKLEVKDY